MRTRSSALHPPGHVSTLVAGVDSPGGQRVRHGVLYFNTGDAAQSGALGTTDGTLQRFDLDTRQRSTYSSGLTMPNGLAFLPNGDAVVSRDIGSGTGITRIRASDPQHPQFRWAPLDDQNGLAVDPTGTWLYADQTFTADSAVYRIRISNPAEMSVLAHLAQGGTPKGLDDLTIDHDGVLYVAANLAGEVIRLDPATGTSCVIVTGLQNPSSLKFGRGVGWSSERLYLTGFDGAVRELTPPPKLPLALTVSPRHPVIGRRVRIRFHALSGGQPVGGVRVRFTGRVAITRPDGRASLVLRFRAPGHRTARAARSSYRPAVARLVVRRP